MCVWYDRDELKSCLAHCEAVIDFGDDDRENDIDDRDMWVLSPRVRALCAELKGHLNDNHRGEIIRDGVRVALIGPPNAGKKALLHLSFVLWYLCVNHCSRM